MDQTAQSTDQQAQTPVVSQPQQNPTPQVQSTPVSVPTGGKERAGGVVAEVQVTHPEVVMPQEVKEVGVEAQPNTEVIELTPEQQAAGLQPAKEATPMPQMPSFNLPIPEEKVVSILKRPHYKDSITWLASLIKKILKKQRSKK